MSTLVGENWIAFILVPPLFKFFPLTLLKYTLYLINCMYLNCTICCFGRYIHLWSHHCSGGTEHFYYQQKSPLAHLESIPSPLLSPDSYWSALSHYRLVCISYNLYKWIIRYVIFLCMDSFFQHSKWGFIHIGACISSSFLLAAE